MASGHPRDELGRVLPHAWWPADRQAPNGLELVRRFSNSVNRESGADRFASADGFDGWLESEGEQPVHCSRAELQRLHDLREILHRLVVANANGDDGSAAWDDLVAFGHHVMFRISRTGDAIRLEPTGSGVDVLIGRLIDAVITARDDGSWPRLKACRNCHWVVFDPSKNRSSRWCSMTACGGRHNAREYRRRNRSMN